MNKYIFYIRYLLFGDEVVDRLEVPCEVKSATYDGALEKALMQAQATVRAYEADGITAFFRIIKKS